MSQLYFPTFLYLPSKAIDTKHPCEIVPPPIFAAEKWANSTVWYQEQSLSMVHQIIVLDRLYENSV